MQQHPLLISSLLRHAARFHKQSRLVTRRADGSLIEQNYEDLEARAAQLANALSRRGIAQGERVGTLAWNDDRHLEAYFAIPGIGAICHTINPRLFDEQIVGILADARDTMLLVDPEFLPTLQRLAPQLTEAGVRTIAVLDDRVDPEQWSQDLEIIGYETLLADEPTCFDWPQLDENSAALLCYTSGTTGNPKGVLYCHRATVLHAYAICAPDVFGLRAIDRIMPVVPMYHVNAWGLPFAAALVGAGLVLPGPHPTPRDLLEVIRRAGVTFTAGVPTVWQGLLGELRGTTGPVVANLRIISGGAALPVSLADAYANEFGIQVNHAWGMTEMSPVGLCNSPKPETLGWSSAEWIAHQRKQGRPLFGVDLKVVDETGKEIAQDGKAFGELLVRGPWIARSYYKHADGGAVDDEGWFHTGDVVTLDQSGYVEIVDRAKDVIKSGGEWISSITLENLAVAHAGVAEAAVIAARHTHWDERPLLIFTAVDPASPPSREDLLDWLSDKVAKWWLPDDVILVDELPHTGTGKLLKTALKERFRDHLLNKRPPY